MNLVPSCLPPVHHWKPGTTTRPEIATVNLHPRRDCSRLCGPSLSPHGYPIPHSVDRSISYEYSREYWDSVGQDEVDALAEDAPRE